MVSTFFKSNDAEHRINTLKEIVDSIDDIYKSGGSLEAMEFMLDTFGIWLKYDEIYDEEIELLLKLVSTGKDCVRRLKRLMRVGVEKETYGNGVDVDWGMYVMEPNVTLDDFIGPMREELKFVVYYTLVALEEKSKPADQRLPIFEDQNIGNFLFVGPPGSGKSFGAKCVAGEVKRYVPDVKFISITASAIRDYRYGMTERRMRSLLEFADKNGPTILYIEEIDSLIRSRKDSHEATASTLNELLSALSGVNAVSDVIVIGSTNIPEVADRAILGERFYVIRFPDPDPETKAEILNRLIPKGYRAFNARKLIDLLKNLSCRQIKYAAARALVYAKMRTGFKEGRTVITESDMINAINDIYKNKF